MKQSLLNSVLSVGTLALLGSLSATSSASTWTHCASEWFTCDVPVPSQVRYGADGQYVFQQVTDSVSCRNSVFGDPAPGTYKSCEYILSSTADHDGDGVVDALDLFPNNSVDSADSDSDGLGDNTDPFVNDATNAADANWQPCANEWFACEVPASALVRYGADGQYFFQQADDVIACRNSTFGDPAPGIYKHCDYLLSDTQDSDGDGVVDNDDAFPDNPLETVDSDGDGLGDNTDPFVNDATNAASSEWQYCSDEWATCSVPTTTWVRFGTNGQYIFQNINDSVACRSSVFGDPVPGVEKQCEYLVVAAPAQDTDGDGVFDSEDAFPNDPAKSTNGNDVGLPPSTAQNRAVSYTYNEFGQVLTVDGPRTDVNDITTYTYDATTQYRNSITDAVGNVTQLNNHNGRGQPQQLIDANGTETLLTYNVRGWLKSVTIVDPNASNGSANSTTDYDYDLTGNIVQITRPDNVQLNYHYDTSNRLIAVSNNAGERIDYVLDNAGNRLSQTISESPANGSVITYSMTQAFDELSRVMEIVGADSQLTQIDYDVNDNAVNNINPRNYATQHQYDALDRLIQTTDANSGTTHFTYDDQDRLTSVTDANGSITTYEYDAFDNLIREVSPDTGETRHSYDNAGNRIGSIDSRGIVTMYGYDALNRLTEVHYPGAPHEDVIYEYDATTFEANGHTHPANAKGRLFRITDHSGQTVYLYDHRGNITSQIRQIGKETDSPVYWTDYLYDLADKLFETQVFLPNGNLNYAINYQYDSLGRVNNISYDHTDTGISPQEVASNLQYLPFGGLTQITYGNSATTQMIYDQDYRLTQWQTNGSNGILAGQLYTFDANSNILATDDLHAPPVDGSDESRIYEYDLLDRLTFTQRQDATDEWTYDAVGNRLTSDLYYAGNLFTGDTYNYEPGSNRIGDIFRGPGNFTVDYITDARGNITEITNGFGSVDAAFSYNAANRLLRATRYSNTADYRYNALGQRIQKTVNGTTTHYTYNLQGQLVGEYQNGQPIVEYIYLNNQPLAQIRSQQLFYYHNDHLGTPQTITDSAQDRVWEASQQAFGTTSSVSFSSSTGIVVSNNLRFPGQYFDQETLLHYNWHRYYDPQLGRYLQSDPIGLDDGPNTYAYVGNNPLVYFDPDGLSRNYRGHYHIPPAKPVKPRPDRVNDYWRRKMAQHELNEAVADEIGKGLNNISKPAWDFGGEFYCRIKQCIDDNGHCPIEEAPLQKNFDFNNCICLDWDYTPK